MSGREREGVNERKRGIEGLRKEPQRYRLCCYPWQLRFLLGPGAGTAIPVRKYKRRAPSTPVSHFPNLVSLSNPARVRTQESGAGVIVRASLRKPHPRRRPTVEDSQNAEPDLTVGGESAHSNANQSGRRGQLLKGTLHI